MPLVRHPDILTGSLLIVAGAVMTYFSWQIDTSPDELLTARFFPVAASIMLALCGLFLLVKGVVVGYKSLPKLGDVRVLGLVIAFLVYFFTFTFVDFRLSTWVVVLVSMYLLGARSRTQLIVTPLAVSLVIYSIFRLGFEILLPEWI
ncbi:MAG: tripartite tricarboxylate transporter TctB family protein [Rhodospirillales bacterium]|nr:tripartite tricarboxylate transporter TctB family protein [Rhodospirillales bacterium]